MFLLDKDNLCGSRMLISIYVNLDMQIFDRIIICPYYVIYTVNIM